MSFPKMTWYDVKVDTCFRSPYNNLLELMQMHSVYELNPSNYPNEKEFIKAVEKKQSEEEKIIGEQSWIEYMKANKPNSYSKMETMCKSYCLDINTIKSFKHYVDELKRIAIISD